MGAVYLAVDHVARSAGGAEVRRARAWRAASSTCATRFGWRQRVTHAKVCRTYDLEEIDGQRLVKMEYVAGETLAQRLARQGRLSVERGGRDRAQHQRRARGGARAGRRRTATSSRRT